MASCVTTGNDSQRPSGNFGNADLQNNAMVLQDWWTFFGDPVLNEMVKTAQNQKLTPEETLNQVKDSRAFTQGSLTKESWGGDSTYEKQSLHEDAPLEKQSANLMLVAEVARDYIAYRQAEQNVARADENLKKEKKILSIFEEQKKAAVNYEQDMQRAQEQVNAAREGATLSVQHMDEERGRLGILTALPPEEIFQKLSQPSTGLSADLAPVLASSAQDILRRPDIEAARKAFFEQTGYDPALFESLIPQETLSHFLGISDNALADNTALLEIKPGATVKKLNFSEIEARIDEDQAQYEQAYKDLRLVVFQAVMDVERAMIDAAKAREQRITLEQALRGVKRDLEDIKKHYADGKGNLPDVLEAQRNAYEMETVAIEAHYAEISTQIGVFKALGVY
ncbi:MAG: TolC family protein [Alphaproteobacteria bacterium]|nr:TolC family protein [Alphaproteobacteria bacterium]